MIPITKNDLMMIHFLRPRPTQTLPALNQQLKDVMFVAFNMESVMIPSNAIARRDGMEDYAQYQDVQIFVIRMASVF